MDDSQLSRWNGVVNLAAPDIKKFSDADFPTGQDGCWLMMTTIHTVSVIRRSSESCRKRAGLRLKATGLSAAYRLSGKKAQLIPGING